MKKLVSIVLATYKPNNLYLIKQLQSINLQNYENIEFLICDDSADENVFLDIQKTVKKYINNFSYEIYKNDENIGSNKTFEKLTQLARGEYIAYCDQDDIWEINKITELVKKLEEERAVLCYSDLSVIDDSDNLISNSFQSYSTRLKHVYGNNKFGFFLRRNSVTGCSMLIKSSIAKNSLPFPEYDEYVHDHWLALCASRVGTLAYISNPLIRYRIHSNNQIGAKVLNGIVSKNDYLNKKLILEEKKVRLVKERYLGYGDAYIKREISKFSDFVNKRIVFFQKRDVKSTIFFIGKFFYDPVLILFELLVNYLPTFLSNKLINRIKK